MTTDDSMKGSDDSKEQSTEDIEEVNQVIKQQPRVQCDIGSMSKKWCSGDLNDHQFCQFMSLNEFKSDDRYLLGMNQINWNNTKSVRRMNGKNPIKNGHLFYNIKKRLPKIDDLDPMVVIFQFGEN